MGHRANIPTDRATRVKIWWEDLAVSLSAANLAFFKPWSDLTLSTSRSEFTDWSYELLSATAVTYQAIVLNVLITAVVFFAMLRVGRASGKRGVTFIVHLAMLATLGAVVNGVRLTLGVGRYFGWLGSLRFAIFAFVGGWLFYQITFRRKELFLKSFRTLALFFLPFCLVTFHHAIDGYLSVMEVSARIQPIIPEKMQPPGRKVIVNLFDELDYRLAFPERPSDMHLPTLDEWRRNSVFAQNAVPPGPSTAYSIPSFFVGERLVEPLRVRDERLAYAVKNQNGDLIWKKWKDQDNLMKELRRKGYKSAIVGWYLPYCRMFARSADFCVRYPHYSFFKKEYSSDLAISMQHLFYEFISLRPERAQFHKYVYENILENAEKAIKDPNVHFVFLHWPVPHAPWIYNKEKKELTSENSKGPVGYFDNLALMEETLRRQTELLKATGQWDTSNLILLSDHGWNSSAEFDGHWNVRSPFMVKLAKQNQGKDFLPMFNTVALKDLVVQILEGSVQTHDRLAEWLDERKESENEGPKG